MFTVQGIYADGTVTINEPVPMDKNYDVIFMLAVNEKLNGIIGTSAITDIYYLLKKQYADTKTTVGIIFDILDIIRPVDTTVKDLFHAAELGFSDFEDAVIAATAQRERADYIVTRNIADFSTSPIPAILPEKLLEKINVHE